MIKSLLSITFQTFHVRVDVFPLSILRKSFKLFFNEDALDDYQVPLFQASEDVLASGQ
jgi:hypothetical protein